MDIFACSCLTVEWRKINSPTMLLFVFPILFSLHGLCAVNACSVLDPHIKEALEYSQYSFKAFLLLVQPPCKTAHGKRLIPAQSFYLYRQISGIILISIVDYEWFLFRLVRRATQERKPREKKIGPASLARTFFSRSLFTVTLDGPSDRGPTHSQHQEV